jgi:hypothetical protein
VGGRKIGLESVKDQEKRREQENHNVGRSDIGSERIKGNALFVLPEFNKIHKFFRVFQKIYSKIKFKKMRFINPIYSKLTVGRTDRLNEANRRFSQFC